MTNPQKNKRNSHHRVCDAFKDSVNVTLIDGVKALKKAVATYLANVEELDTLARRESAPLLRIAQDKATLKRTMCADALPLAGALKVPAGDRCEGGQIEICRGKIRHYTPGHEHRC